MKKKTIEILKDNALKSVRTILYGVPTTVNGVPYVLITHGKDIGLNAKRSNLS